MKTVILCLFLILPLQIPYALANSMVEFEQKFINHQQNLPKGDIKQITYAKKLIDYMYVFDQDFRKHFISNDKQLRSLLKRLDAFHTSKMKEILNEWGWITISKFGLEYDQKAWLLVQHADEDPFFQAGVLFILANLADKGETDKKNYAYLYDRVAAKFHHLGMFQKYGTQVDMTDTDVTLQPYEGSIEDIDKLRSKIGLEPLNEYLNQIREVYSKKHIN